MFVYLCERVLEQSASDIHEHEVGQKVFGRPVDYDSTADNIVRVHASMLRKRIDQYFANEGSSEPIVIDIPKGNYAPVFRKRTINPQPLPFSSTDPPVDLRWRWKMWVPLALAAVFACSTVFLLMRVRHEARSAPALPADRVNVRHFWSQIFQPERPADIVLDDATLGFFQEATARQVVLSEYFDRSYVRSVRDSAATTKMNRELAEPLVLKRQSSYANAVLLWKLAQTAGALQSDAKIHFARDYSFRELKADNVILLGNSRSNPWIQPFESLLGLRWKFDNAVGAYYPIDMASPDEGKFHSSALSAERHEGYATVSLLRNLGGTGKVVIISGTGGATVGAALDFLSDERSVSQLRSLLPPSNAVDFPYFEALLKVTSRGGLPRDTSILVCRPPGASVPDRKPNLASH